MEMACEFLETPVRNNWLVDSDLNSESLNNSLSDSQFDDSSEHQQLLRSQQLAYMDAVKRGQYGGQSRQREGGPDKSATRGFIRSTEGLARILRNPIRVYGYLLPRELSEIANRIAASHSMLDLLDGWDDYGSPGYKTATWLNATLLIANASTNYWETTDRVPPPPAILRGSDGDIDIVWRSGSSTLLANIPSDDDEFPSFLGTDSRNPAREIRGTLEARDGNGWLLEWLTQ